MRHSNKFKLIVFGLSGNVLEWFDFAVYGYLAPVIASQFFPSTDPLASILLTYSVFALGFLARPIGSVFFGHLGDTKGRKNSLILSCLVMAIPTTFIGMLPTYQTIGLASPLLLVCCRILQGLSIGGEFTGSFIYLTEQAEPHQKGFFSCWADIGCSLGMILGSLSVALLNGVLTHTQLSSFGWRLPFLSGFLLGFLVFYLRMNLPESKEFIQPAQSDSIPFIKLLTKFPKKLGLNILLVSLNSLGFYLLLVFLPNQIALFGRFNPSRIYLLNTVILFIFTATTFFSAVLCDYFDTVKIYLVGPITCIIFSALAGFAFIKLSLVLQVVCIGLIAAGLGFSFGPRSLFMTAVFPTDIRFTGIALSLNTANAVLGGGGPLVASYLVAKTGSIAITVLLIIIAALATLFSILKLRGECNGFGLAAHQQIKAKRNYIG